ncbi:MAG: 2-oxoacid:acceptor oxidoreductase family protein [Spirochaetales bacterium]|nr:2-oxoacid:acceptor oxidoreductase family protein [Spirochaetales bacterium]MCF7938439.1 2-oxoacid:acceptor oxidoreductase family protein [Spirochaetales bacterium]
MVQYSKPRSFYDTFERKGEGQISTHYCPGCGHGNAHKLIAEAIDTLGIQDRVVFLSPVGCSVFAYYYFDTGNIQCAHGRAPSVGTGVRKTLDDAIVISYQGDGDLAGIGMASIVHAANRGENITVFFVNNAIYGMTGGQMAPTTLIDQKTQTTPLGRNLQRDGNPIGMCELMDSLETPVYIERVTFSSPAKIMKARKVVRKALQNQIDKKGFSFVEILSPCPVNWKMSPTDARRWVSESLEPIFPVKNFRDLDDVRGESAKLPLMEGNRLLDYLKPEKHISPEAPNETVVDQQVKIAGFGGQGVMSAGVLLSNCVIQKGLNTTWLPSYGPEMRGGTAYASVKVSTQPIGSPVVDFPNVLIAMNGPSLEAFEEKVPAGGLIMVNTSLISRKVQRKDVRTYYLPATELAKDVGLIATANIIVLSIYFLISEVVDLDTFRKVIPLSLKKKQLAEMNLQAVDKAEVYFSEHPLEQS